jgi:hypothetical protein
MVGRGLRTICPMGEDHPGLNKGEVEKRGETNLSLVGGGSWTWATRATMHTNASISTLLVSNADPPTGCHGKRLLEMI